MADPSTSRTLEESQKPAPPVTQAPAFAHPTQRDGGLIVFERSGWWAARLRGLLDGHVAMFQVRSAGELRETLRSQCAAMILSELDGWSQQAIPDLLVDLSRRWPAAPIVLVARRGFESSHLQLCEIGAAHVAFEPRDVSQLADLARRHFEQLAEPDLTLIEQICAKLPWNDLSSCAAP